MKAKRYRTLPPAHLRAPARIGGIIQQFIIYQIIFRLDSEIAPLAAGCRGATRKRAANSIYPRSALLVMSWPFSVSMTASEQNGLDVVCSQS